MIVGRIWPDFDVIAPPQGDGYSDIPYRYSERIYRVDIPPIWQEVIFYVTYWEDPDTDDDSLDDGEEVEAGTDPNHPMSHPVRTIPGALFLLLKNKI